VNWRFSLFNSVTDNQPREVDRTWRDFCELVTKPVVRQAKDGELLSPAIFDPKRRAKANVVELSALALDLDHGVSLENDLSRFGKLGCAFAAYTTHSHKRITDSNPNAEERFRIVLPLATPIPALYYPALWAWANQQSGGKLDPATKDASRIFYLPAKAASDSPYYYEICEGWLLDWRELPAIKFARSAFEGEISALGGTQNGQRNNQLFKSAAALGELVAGGCLDEDRVIRALEEGAIKIGLDADSNCGPDGIRATIQSGLRTGRAKPRHPDAFGVKLPPKTSTEKTGGQADTDESRDVGASLRKDFFDGKLILELKMNSRGAPTLKASNGAGVLRVDRIALDKDADRRKFVKALLLSDDEQVTVLNTLCEWASIDVRANTSAVVDADANGDGKPSLSLLLIELALTNSELFHDAGGDCYASLNVNSHRETHKLGSRDYKDWLAGLLYRTTERAATGDKISEAITVLRAKARYESPETETHVRVAEHDGAIYLDLCDKDWRQVKITEEDWRVIESNDSPIRFRRAGGMLALPEPVRGGELRELRELLNLLAGDSDNWPLLLGWLIATLKPCNATRFAYPLLTIHGEQGSAKSTTCRLLRRLIDPNKADLRATPKDERDLAIAAEHGRVLAFDNLTYLSDSLSNALCRLATGGGFATRELFTDEGEVIFDSQRPVILNGIAEVVTKSDLLDRAILIYLPQIDRRKRKLDRVIDREFATAQPRILGALLDAASKGLRALKQGVTLDALPRMADFAEWVTACEQGLGLSKGQFLDAYRNNQEKANGLAIEASPVAQAIIALIADCDDFVGTTGGLLKALNGRLEANGENPAKKHGWPRSARALGAKLKEIAPNLRRNGVEVAFGERGRGGYTIQLEKAEPGEHRKEVHNVHNVHGANEINNLDREHWRERLENKTPGMFTDGAPSGDCEHVGAGVSANVHGNVHTVNGCKQKAGEHREHREHLSPTQLLEDADFWALNPEAGEVEGEWIG
jgi:hypothetical protein